MFLKSQKGFTIVELITVMAIMGIMTFVALPFMGDYTHSANLDSAVRVLESDIRFVQSLAMTTGESYGFRAISDHEYEAYEVSSGNRIVFPDTKFDFYRDIDLDYGGLLFTAASYPAYQVEFDVNGLPNVVTPTNIILENALSDTKQVTVTPNSGLIRRTN